MSVQRPKFSSVPRNSTDLLYSGLFLLFQGILLRACRLITSLLPLSFIPHLLNVSKGFEKKLEIVGVGYRANMEGSNLNMALGYSHPVLIVPPAGITLSVEANTKITVAGTNKQAVGDVAAFIRSKRPPEVYKGKGVKYEGEYIRRKAGKAGKK